MKTVRFLNKDVRVPEKWQDVTVKMQIRAAEIESAETYVKSLGMISAYTSVPVDDLKKARIEDVKEILQHLSFLNEEIKAMPCFVFTFKDEEYHVKPNILEQEFQDFVAAQTAMMEYKDEYWKQLTYLLAINAKKEGESLNDFNINDRAKHFEDIDVVTVSGIAAFFLSNQMLSNYIIQLSSKEEINKEVLESLKELQHTTKTLKKQRGGNLLIKSWIMISQKYSKSLAQAWEKYYNSLH